MNQPIPIPGWPDQAALPFLYLPGRTWSVDLNALAEFGIRLEDLDLLWCLAPDPSQLLLRRFGFGPTDPWITKWYVPKEDDNEPVQLNFGHLVGHWGQRGILIGTLRSLEIDGQRWAGLLTIDVDCHDGDKASVLPRVAALQGRLGVPVMVRSSDSGGLHLYYALQAPAGAQHRWMFRVDVVVPRVNAAIQQAGIPNVEVYPKGLSKLRFPFGLGSCLLNPDLQPMDGETTPTNVGQQLATFHRMLAAYQQSQDEFLSRLPQVSQTMVGQGPARPAEDSEPQFHDGPEAELGTGQADYRRRCECLLRDGLHHEESRVPAVLQLSPYLIGSLPDLSPGSEAQVTTELTEWLRTKHNGLSNGIRTQGWDEIAGWIATTVKRDFAARRQNPQLAVRTRMSFYPDEVSYLLELLDWKFPGGHPEKRRAAWRFLVDFAEYIKRRGTQVSLGSWKVDVPRKSWSRFRGASKKPEKASYYRKRIAWLGEAGILLASSGYSAAAARSRTYDVQYAWDGNGPIMFWQIAELDGTEAFRR